MVVFFTIRDCKHEQSYDTKNPENISPIFLKFLIQGQMIKSSLSLEIQSKSNVGSKFSAPIVNLT